MTTRLKLFQEALRELGQPTMLATEGVTGVAGRAIAEVIDDTILYCLEQGYWNFAQRSATLATQGGVVLFGYTYPHVKPTDWVRTVRLSTSNKFWPPYESYEDAKNCIHADTTPLYMSYISSATDTGLRLTRWPQSFTKFVACELAARVCERAGGSREKRDDLHELAKGYLADARSKDAMNEGIRFPPQGRLVASRRGGSGGDRGNRGSLTG
jgi:hypothetical protein